jgi:hypothetical protein
MDESAAVGVVGSEFAQVRVAIDTGANGVRLRLTDLRTGQIRHLDALELETLVWLPADVLRAMLDPALRWREDDQITEFPEKP